MKIKPKYLLEASAVLLLLGILLAFALPRFLEAQHRVRANALQSRLDEWLKQAADRTNGVSLKTTYHSPAYVTSSRNAQGEITFPNQMKLIESGVDINGSLEKSPGLPPFNWELTPYQLFITVAYPLEDPDTVNIGGGYSDTPMYMRLSLVIGEKTDHYSAFIRRQVDEEGYYKITGDRSHFSPTNGLYSTGTLHSDTLEIWPLPKAVFLRNPNHPDLQRNPLSEKAQQLIEKMNQEMQQHKEQAQ